jgi:hypothetical protein
MKEILFALILGFTFVPAPGGGICAQNSRKVIEFNVRKNFIPSIRNLAALVDPGLSATYMLGRNEINLRALRDFMNRYDQEDHVFWFSTPDGGFESYFIRDGYGDRVIYDRKGNWLFSLINYGEDKLPRNIRSTVKSVYFDFKIILVEEIQRTEGIEYIVSLEDQSNIRVVKVNREGELEVLQELDK